MKKLWSGRGCSSYSLWPQTASDWELRGASFLALASPGDRLNDDVHFVGMAKGNHGISLGICEPSADCDQGCALE